MKSVPIIEVENLKAIKITEKPNKKDNVCNNALRFNMPFSSLSSLKEIHVI